MSNIATELDCAKDILSTYHQVHDEPARQKTAVRSKLQAKNKALEEELLSLKEKYLRLQNELNHRDERLSRLNRQLIDRTTHIVRLQEDFEHAIQQFTGRKND